jgi:hypothetical protein
MTEQKDKSAPCHIERSPARIVTEIFVNSVSTVHSRTNFEEFCELLDVKADEYAQEKWRLLNELVGLLNNLDLLTLAKVIEVGSPNLELSVQSKPQELLDTPPLTEPPTPESSNEITP